MRWSIDTTHQQHGLTTPTDDTEVKQKIKSQFRTMAEHRPEQFTQSKKKPFTINQIRIMYFPKGVLGLRDKALLLLGFATGMRGFELTAVRKDHIEETEYGIGIRIPRSKSDQLGEGDTVDVIRAGMGQNQRHYPVKTVQVLMGENPYEHLFVRVRRVNTPGGYRRSKMLSEPNRFIARQLDENVVYRIFKKETWEAWLGRPRFKCDLPLNHK